jgi:glycosyltransferase involved in cell wall biosynthesis
MTAPPLRVSYVWDADYPWDVRTAKLCRTLAEAGHAVEIVARNRRWAAEREELPEGRVRRMRPCRLAGRRLDGLLSFPAFANPRWYAHIAASVRAHRPDVVVVRDLPLALTALWAGRRAGVPVVCDLAENYPAMMRDIWTAGRARPSDWLVRNPRAVELVERYALPRMDHVLTVVEESSSRVAALGVAAARLTVVGNTPPLARLDAPRPERAPGGPLRLVYLGLMEVPRGVLEVLEAVARLLGAGQAIECALIGDGRDLGIFRARAEALGLGPAQVRFHGALPNAEALRLVAAADVGLVPHHAVESWNTTIPNKLFDYMAAGLPVLTSDAVPAARIVRATKAGLVFRSGDAEDLAARVRELADPDRRARMAEAGREAVRREYHWERDAAALERALRATVAGARRAGAAPGGLSAP